MSVVTSGTTVSAGGLAISNASGSFSTSSTSAVDVTNLSVTITTTGRPVIVKLIGDSSGFTSQIQVSALSSEASFTFRAYLLRGVTIIDERNGGIDQSPSVTTGSISYPASTIDHIDFPVAGTYTYKIQVQVNAAATSVSFTNLKLLAYEL